MTCQPWCDDHLKVSDIDYCQSTERQAGTHGIVLVGPGHDDSGEGALFWQEKFGGPFDHYPFDREMAEMCLHDLRVALIAEIDSRTEAIKQLEGAIQEVWG